MVMRTDKRFLIGNFLPGYVSAVKGPAYDEAPHHPTFEAGDLSDRLAARSARRARREGRYTLFIQVGLVAAMLMATLALTIPWTAGEGHLVLLEEQDVVTLQEIVPTRQVSQPPAPPRPPIPVEVPDDTIIDEHFDFDATLDLEEVLVAGALSAPDPSPVREEPTDEIFVIVEEMPEMIGGYASLAADLKYPEIARKAGLEGTVIVQITVQETGDIRDPAVVRSAGSVLDEAALEALLKQQFHPGKQRGRPVAVRMNVPIHFKFS